MKIKLLKNIGIAGQHNEAGTVVKVTDRIGLELVGLGRAVLVEDAPAEATAKEEAPAEDAITDTLPEDAKPAKKK
jgi:hypothetical protein